MAILVRPCYHLLMINTQSMARQLNDYYGLANPICVDLNTLANYAIEVRTDSGHFALKLYNPTSRTAQDVQWEIDLTLHLLKNDVPVAPPVVGNNDNYVQIFNVEGEKYATVLFEWAAGAKPTPELSTYTLIGEAAARIHNASDTFS